jgi:hypothetical protein
VTVTSRKSRPPDTEPAEPDPILRPKEIEELTGVAWKTIARARPDAVIQLGKRAVAMRKSDVLRPLSRAR